MASVQERIFRSSALARHTSPEGLDTLLEITTVRWVALIGLVAVVMGAVVWGVLGRIPQVVPGQGIMVAQGGLYRIQSSGSGRVDSMYVRAGAEVKAGQVLAVLAQPELRTVITQLETTLSELESNRATTSRLLESDRKLGLASIEQQQRQADEAVAAADQQLVALDARIANERQALERGLLTPDVLQQTIATRAEIHLQRLATIARKQELGAEAVQLQVSSNRDLFALEQQIRQSSNRLDQLRAQLATDTYVNSPYDGVVVEQLVDVGQAIGSGTPIVTVEPIDVPAQVLMFIPLEGKRIAPGMRVEMVPGGVRPEETGYFLGEVRAVSSAPLSGSALDRYLKNEVLVEQFTESGGAYLVEINVARDTTTVSQFKWTSHAGAPISFGSGTLLAGRIVVDEQRPISLVIPAIRKWFGS